MKDGDTIYLSSERSTVQALPMISMSRRVRAQVNPLRAATTDAFLGLLVHTFDKGKSIE